MRKLNSPCTVPNTDADDTAAVRNVPVQPQMRRDRRPLRTRVLAVTSGKGGVGKTNFVANLAAVLTGMGKSVIVLDADFGLANLDVLLGLNPRFHLGHVIFGKKSLAEIMVEGPGGIRVIPASSGLQRLSELTLEQRNTLVQSFEELEGLADYLLIDTAAGISSNVLHFLLAVPEVVVVSAPEPTAIVDAYAVIKIVLTEDPGKTIRVLINSAADEEESRDVFSQINSVVKRFLNREVIYLGHVLRDQHVLKAVRGQVLVTHFYPGAPATRCFQNIAQSMELQTEAGGAAQTFVWEKLLNHWVN